MSIEQIALDTSLSFRTKHSEVRNLLFPLSRANPNTERLWFCGCPTFRSLKGVAFSLIVLSVLDRCKLNRQGAGRLCFTRAVK
jgi:hypothetical protein